MTKNEKEHINQKTENRHLLRRGAAGLASLWDNPGKIMLVLGYLLLALLLWLNRGRVFRLEEYELISPVLGAVLRLLFPLYTVGGLLTLLVILGTPRGSRAAKENLQKAGLTNHTGESPVLTRKYQDGESSRITVWEFDPCGIPLKEWEDKRGKIEAALNLTIAKITWGKDKRRVLVYAVPAGEELPHLLSWKAAYLRKEISHWCSEKVSPGLCPSILPPFPMSCWAAPPAPAKASY